MPPISVLNRLLPLLEAAAAGKEVSLAAGDLLREINAYLGSDNILVIQPPKLKREYVGRRVRTLRQFSNGWGIIQAGLISDSCPCCGLQAKISGIGAADIEFVE